MTLKNRNRYTLVLSFLFLGISLISLIYFLFNLKSPTLGTPFFNFKFSLEDFSPLKQSDLTVLFAQFCLLVYIPTAAFYIYQHFIKTPSGEVIYFMIFLLGCTAEFLRLSVPMEIVQNTAPDFLVLIGRALFYGRTLCFAGLFLSAVAGAPDQRINAEQYIFMILISLIVLAEFVSVDTTEISKVYSVKVGMNFFANCFYTIIAVLTFLTYIFKAWQNENKNYALLGIDCVLIEAGMICMNTSARLVVVLIGTVLLYTGTFRYLHVLHKLYV